MADITITQKITIELDGKSPFEYVVMKQGDKGSRILAVSLLQNKQPYEIPTGCTARIKYYKPDGNPVLNDCTLSGNEILVTYTEQMLAAAGVGKGEIVLLKGGKELKSATYYTKIVETVYKTDGFVSDKEFLSMGTIFNDMDQAAQAAAANAKIAETAAAAANRAANSANGAASTANSAAEKPHQQQQKQQKQPEQQQRRRGTRIAQLQKQMKRQRQQIPQHRKQQSRQRQQKRRQKRRRR